MLFHGQRLVREDVEALIRALHEFDPLPVLLRLFDQHIYCRGTSPDEI